MPEAADIVELLGNVAEEDFIQEPSTEIFANEDIKTALQDYLATELEEVASNAGRGTKIERNKTIDRQRLARPEDESKTFPWDNASNIEPPFALQKINTIVTKLVQAYASKDPIFRYKADEPFTSHAEAVTRHIQKLMKSQYAVDIYNKLWPMMYDCVSYGTQFVKVPFDINRMKFNKINQEGATEVVDRIIKASPSVIPIPFEDFLTRAEWPDIQKAPWIAVRYHKHTHELKRLQQQGFYSNVDAIINEQAGLDDSKEERLSQLGIDTVGAQNLQNYWYDIFECNVFWDVDGDGFDEDVIVHIEKSTKTILRAEYNELGMRDYVRLPYIDIPNALYAIGVGDIMIPLQDEAASLHNMRNDSMQLSTLPFMVTSNASDFGGKIELYPGKIIKTPNPREDVIVHKFPDVGLSSISAEGLLKEYADNATGASDILSGNDAGGYNRIGAQGTQFLAGQSNGFLDSIASNIANQMANVGMLVLFQLVRNSEFIDYEGIPESDRLLLEQVYGMNVEDIPSKFKFQATVAAIEDSKQAKQSQAINLMQMYSLFGDKMTQIMAQLDNPQLDQTPRVKEMIGTYAVGFTKLMESALGDFDTDDVGDFLPYTRDMALALRLSDSQKDIQVDNVERQTAIGQTAGASAAVSNDPTGGGSPNEPTGAGQGDAQGTVQTAPQTGTVGGEPV